MNHYQLGRKDLDTGDLSAAQNHFQEGLEQGDPRCAYGLVALAALRGESLESPLAHLTHAIPAIQSLADRGDADSSFILGRCYETGSSVPQSIPDALRWYMQSASLGNSDAMFNLGCIYLSFGSETEKLALAQFQQAADHGNRDAILALAHYRKHHRA